MSRILMILTSHDQLGDTGKKTGFWLEEFASPYYVFRDAGHDVTLASPKGGQPPIDPTSSQPQMQTDATRRFNDDEQAKAAMAATVRSPKSTSPSSTPSSTPVGTVRCGTWRTIPRRSRSSWTATPPDDRWAWCATPPVCCTPSPRRTERRSSPDDRWPDSPTARRRPPA